MEDHPQFRAFGTSILIMAAGSAYFVSPLLPFFNAALLAYGGMVASVGCGFLWLEAHARNRNWRDWLFMAITFAGLGTVTFAFNQAQDAYRANGERCALIQHMMLDGKPDATDLPALFSALDCSPRGKELFKLPPEPKKDAR